MKRRAFQIVVLLILGAIVNVAVAWGIEINSGTLMKVSYRGFELRSTDPQFIDGLAWAEEIGFQSKAADDCFRYQILGYGAQVWGLRQTMLYENPVHSGNCRTTGGFPGRYVGIRIWVGWPCWSLYEERLGAWYDGPEYSSYKHRYSFLVKCRDASNAISTDPGYLLPYFPIWPGFAINTIFYAAVLWMVFALPFALRRRRRIKRGLCPACAYLVGTSPVCTECGVAVRLKSL